MNECRICHKRELSTTLGNVLFCNHCKTAQSHQIAKQELVCSYLSEQHYKKIIEELDALFFKENEEKRMLTIGLHERTLADSCTTLGYEVVHIETAQQICNLTIGELGESFDIIHGTEELFHLEELHSAIETLRLSLKEEGIFVIQCLYAKSLMENELHHEHPLYYTVTTLNTLLELHGLELFDAYISPLHGGSIIGFAAHIESKAPTERLNLLLQEEKETKINTKEAYIAFLQKNRKNKAT